MEPPSTAIFVFEHPGCERQAKPVLRRLPPLAGEPVLVGRADGLRDSHGAVLAGSFLRTRRIAFDCTGREFPRVFVHEVFHFVWLRRPNAVRRSFEEMLRREWLSGARGELGWSAEWRKARLSKRDLELRTRRWREYCCESFCDTAASLYSGLDRHDEFTLAPCYRRMRRAWFRNWIEPRSLSI